MTHGLVIYDGSGKPVFSNPGLTQAEAEKLKGQLGEMDARIVTHDEAVAASREMVKNCL